MRSPTTQRGEWMVRPRMGKPQDIGTSRRVEGALHLAAGAIVSVVTLGLLPILWIGGAPGESYLAVGIILIVTLGWAGSGLATISGRNGASWVARGFLVVLVALFVWAATT